MRRVYSFGKIAYNGKRKTNEVTLEIELRDYNGKRKINEATLKIGLRNFNGYPEFTACVSVWNSVHSDIVAGGQMIDDLYNEFEALRHSVVFRTIMQLWKKYHLHNISDIPADDRELLDLLFSDKGSKEIEGILKSRKAE